MRPISFFMRQSSPITLAREAVWRAQRQWAQYTFPARVRRKDVPHEWNIPPYYIFDLSQCSSRARTVTVAAAEEISEGLFPLLGFGAVRLGFPPPWHKDVISGHLWPTEPARDIVAVRNDGSDVKIPWELSRLQVAPVLAKAFRITGNRKYRELAMQLIEAWRAANPVGYGINWNIAMEAALRILSLCFTVALLQPAGSGEDRWFDEVLRSVWEHMAFIEHHLEFSHVARGNHYLSNVLGLFCASCFLAGDGIEKTRAQHRELLEREIRLQVYADGVSFEAAVAYHAFVAQMFGTGALLMKAVGLEPSDAYLERLAGMTHFMNELASPDAVLPHVGDCDDGRTELLVCDLERYFTSGISRDSLRVPDLIGLLAALTDQPCRFGSDDVVWHGLPQARRAEPGDSAVFAESGVAIVRRGNAELAFFAMPNGIAGKGSHTHNDKLSIVFRLDGEELFTDSGTGWYTRDPVVRNLLRGTSAHSSVRINDQEQNSVNQHKAYLFCMGDEARVAQLAVDASNEVAFLRAGHSGYERLGVLHTRTLKLSSSTLQIEDEFCGSGEHQLELTFITPPNWHITPVVSEGTNLKLLISGACQVVLTITTRSEANVSVLPATLSRSYGLTEPGHAVRIRTTSSIPTAINSRINWNNED